MIHSEYLQEIFQPEEYKKTIEWVKKALKKFEFDAIAFRGTSGSAIAFPLSYELGIPLLYVRKDSSHHCSGIEGFVDCKRYVIIDDMVSSGETIKIIQDTIQTPSGFWGKRSSVPQCVGAIFYYISSAYRMKITKDTFLKIFPNAKVVVRVSSIPGEELEYLQPDLVSVSQIGK